MASTLPVPETFFPPAYASWVWSNDPSSQNTATKRLTTLQRRLSCVMVLSSLSIAWYVNGPHGRTDGNLLQHESSHKTSPPSNLLAGSLLVGFSGSFARCLLSANRGSPLCTLS